MRGPDGLEQGLRVWFPLITTTQRLGNSKPALNSWDFQSRKFLVRMRVSAILNRKATRIRFPQPSKFGIAPKEKKGWHEFRHTFASRRAQQGISLYKIMKWLGHSSIQVTQIYAHFAPATV